MVLLEDVPSLRVGDRILVRYGRGHAANRTYHIRGFVDDQVIVRRWRRNSGEWHYEALDEVDFRVFGPQMLLRRARTNSFRCPHGNRMRPGEDRPCGCRFLTDRGRERG